MKMKSQEKLTPIICNDELFFAYSLNPMKVLHCNTETGNVRRMKRLILK